LTAPARAGFVILGVGAKKRDSRSNKETAQERKIERRSETAWQKRPHTRGDCIDPHGFDAGKLIKGKKRHILVDTLGLLLHAIVHAADVQDRDGGLLLLATLFGKFPILEKLFADSHYQGPIFPDGLAEILPYLKPKSSNDPTAHQDSCSYPSVGSSSVRSLGSTAAAVSPRTGKISIAAVLPSWNSPPSASCCESSAILDEVLRRTLKQRAGRS
jgi:Transposase DDE domain